MRARGLTVIAIVLVTSVASADDGAPTFRFASREDGARILRRRDEFIRALGPFDRAARMHTARAVGEKKFLAYIAGEVREWDAARRDVVTAALDRVRKSLEGRSLPLPATIDLVLTTGAEEGRAAYTRGSAIVLPATVLPVGGSKRAAVRLERLLIHELFHILSRHAPRLRRALYAIIGFEPCGDVELPARLKPLRLTNPDAPHMRHRVRVEHDGETLDLVPVLYSSSATYDEKRGGEFFRYLVFRLMVVEKHAGAGGRDVWKAAVDDDGEPRLLEPRRVPGYHAKIGRNTGYIVHPEEVLADCFGLLVTGATNVPTPRILKSMDEVLRASVHSDGGAPEKGT